MSLWGGIDMSGNELRVGTATKPRIKSVLQPSVKHNYAEIDADA
jgi:hypothetical protein